MNFKSTWGRKVLKKALDFHFYEDLMKEVNSTISFKTFAFFLPTHSHYKALLDLIVFSFSLH